MFENMAFFDSVSIIAGRAIVTIDPIPEKTKQPPVVHQPKRIKWFVQDDDKKNEENDKKSNNKENIPVINTNNADSDSDKQDDVSSKNSLNLSVNTQGSKDSILEKPGQRRDQRSPSVSKLNRAQTLAVIRNDDDIQMRKKGLRERRMSRSQTFNFNYNNNIELPLIRQSSMPKFYLDTPDQTDSAMVKTPGTALSPVPTTRFDFDLRSVVQLEKDKEMEMKSGHVPVHGDPERSSRLAQIRGKLRPLKIKRQQSVSNIPNSVLHM